MRVQLLSAVAAAALLGFACNSNSTVVVTPLDAPDSLVGVSLNEAVLLYWADNAFTSAPTRFGVYTVYSASYNLDANVCGAYSIEGTTVSPEFLVGELTNGVPRCFRVTAIAKDDGSESAFSSRWQDTPRPDARNVLLYASAVNLGSSGFRFWDDANSNGVGEPSELGLVEAGNLPGIDFVVHLHADSSLWIRPVFTGDSLQFYGTVDDLTDIDYAPASGYSRDSAQAYPEDGYVFQMRDTPSSPPQYAALRLTHVGKQYIIFDWSVQTDPGNPELQLRGGQLTAKATGSVVTASK